MLILSIVYLVSVHYAASALYDGFVYLHSGDLDLANRALVFFIGWSFPAITVWHIVGLL